ncbi:unnamed protein product, partial [Staurois parvus]
MADSTGDDQRLQTVQMMTRDFEEGREGEPGVFWDTWQVPEDVG